MERSIACKVAACSHFSGGLEIEKCAVEAKAFTGGSPFSIVAVAVESLQTKREAVDQSGINSKS